MSPTGGMREFLFPDSRWMVPSNRYIMFRAADLMGAETKLGLNIDMKMINEAMTPRLQYLWQPGR